MRPSVPVLAVHLLAAACREPTGDSYQPPDQTPRPVIEGVVTSIEDGAPVAAAHVVARFWTGNIVGQPSVGIGSAYSNAEGRYRLTLGSAPRGYTLSCELVSLGVSHASYVSNIVGACVQGFPGGTIDVQLSPAGPPP